MFLLPKKIVGLDFHDYFAQVVELSGSDKKASLGSFNRVSIPPNMIKDGEIVNKEELKKIIGTFLESANPEAIKAKKVVCSFPSKKIFTHIFKFPSILSEKEIKKAIPFEAETVIPFAIQDVYWDFRILKKEDVTKKHASQYILFACVPKTVADSYVDLLTSLGLTPVAFTISAESAEYALSKQLASCTSSLVIDVSSLATTYSIFEKGKLKNTSLSLDGGRSLIAALAKKYEVSEAEIIDQKDRNKFNDVYLEDIEAFVDKILTEGKLFVDGFEISHVFITGEFLNLPRFIEEAKRLFLSQKVSFGDPRVGIKIDSDKFLPFDQKDGVVPYSIYFTQAIGLALKGLSTNVRDGINLLPDSLRETFASKKTSFIVGTAAVTMTAISLAVATGMTIERQNLIYQRLAVGAERQSLQQLVFGTRYQEIKDAITKFNNEVTSLSKIQGSLFSVPTLVDDVLEAIPNGISLSSMHFDDADLSLELSGVAKDRDALLKLQKNFEAKQFVEEVVAPRSNFDENSNISFILKLKLKFSDLKKY